MDSSVCFVCQFTGSLEPFKNITPSGFENSMKLKLLTVSHILMSQAINAVLYGIQGIVYLSSISLNFLKSSFGEIGFRIRSRPSSIIPFL